MLQGTQPNGCNMCAYLMPFNCQEKPANFGILFATEHKHVQGSRALYQKRRGGAIKLCCW
jgi:hypothetical protein